MQSNHDSRNYYVQNIRNYQHKLKDNKRRNILLSWLRLIVFFGVIAIVATLLENNWFIASFSSLFFGLGLFIYITVVHSKNELLSIKYKHLIEINENGIKRIDGEWTRITDDGKEFIDRQHPYSYDLDIFGHFSIFQWINSSNTYFGRHALKEALLKPPREVITIIKKQTAIKELSAKANWRQNFQAEGRLIQELQTKPQGLLDWLSAEIKPFNQFHRYIYLAFPLFSIGLSLYGTLILRTPFFLYFTISLHAILFLKRFKKNSLVLHSIDKNKEKIDAYSTLITMCENEVLHSEYLLTMQKKLVDHNGKKASENIKKLSKIVHQSAILSSNMIGPIVSIAFFWDAHCVLSLQKWKETCREYVTTWFDILGEMESLSSLANIVFEQPEWPFPQFEENQYFFKGKQLGHPLIHKQQRICNDLKLDQNKRIMIITGSNMSGKSTMLRTIGINLVLAYSGAPVCAKNINCSLFTVYTSMRQSDNLENHVSTFYAELQRIKNLIDADVKQSKLLFLIDEIFRGTNSKDRHDAAKTVLAILNQKQALGLITTHDYDLAKIADQDQAFINGHFEEHYKNQTIVFDYLLKSGVSKTSNGMFLLKVAGIVDTQNKEKIIDVAK